MSPIPHRIVDVCSLRSCSCFSRHGHDHTFQRGSPSGGEGEGRDVTLDHGSRCSRCDYRVRSWWELGIAAQLQREYASKLSVSFEHIRLAPADISPKSNHSTRSHPSGAGRSSALQSGKISPSTSSVRYRGASEDRSRIHITTVASFWLETRRIPSHQLEDLASIPVSLVRHCFPSRSADRLDAHNLAVKLAPLLRQGGNLSTALDCYQRERRPIALRNAWQSVFYGRKVFDLVKAFHTDNPDIAEASRAMQAALADEQQRRIIEQQVEEQRDQFNSVSGGLRTTC